MWRNYVASSRSEGGAWTVHVLAVVLMFRMEDWMCMVGVNAYNDLLSGVGDARAGYPVELCRVELIFEVWKEGDVGGWGGRGTCRLIDRYHMCSPPLPSLALSLSLSHTGNATSPSPRSGSTGRGRTKKQGEFLKFGMVEVWIGG